jgi:hypothetical protein
MKKMPYLFPIEEIQYVQLSDRMIFHRQKTSAGNRSLLGPLDEYCVKGFAVLENIPSGSKNTVVGTFLFKGSEQRTDRGGIELRDEASVRYVMAGIVLGERSANYQRKGVLINVTPGRIADLNIAIEIWQKWNWEWTEPDFRERCNKENVLPLHEAVKSLKSVGVNITTEALSKHLQRLKLPL